MGEQVQVSTFYEDRENHQLSPDSAIRGTSLKALPPFTLFLHFLNTIFASIYPFSVAFQGGALWPPIANKNLLLQTFLLFPDKKVFPIPHYF